MPGWLSNSLVLMAAGSLLIATVLYSWALARSRRTSCRDSGAGPYHPPSKDFSDVLMALATALVAGGAVAICVFILQQGFIEQRDRETRLLMTADLSGYDPGPSTLARGRLLNDTGPCIEDAAKIAQRTFLKGRYLAAKQLRSARLGGLNLERTEFRDADLSGAIFRCSRLVGATLRHADLSGSDLRGANLSQADLRGASLERANLTFAPGAWNGAKVNAQTCWPRGVDRKVLKGWGVTPWVMRGAHAHARAYGHFCGTAEVIREPWMGAGGSLPLAAGETRPSAVPTLKVDESSLRQLAQALQETLLPELNRRAAQATAAAASPTSPAAPREPAPAVDATAPTSSP